MRFDIGLNLCYAERMGRMKAPRQAISESLRSYIKRDGRSLYALAEVTGVNRGVLSRFVRSERDIGMATADRLCKALGLKLTKGR